MPMELNSVFCVQKTNLSESDVKVDIFSQFTDITMIEWCSLGSRWLCIDVIRKVALAIPPMCNFQANREEKEFVDMSESCMLMTGEIIFFRTKVNHSFINLHFDTMHKNINTNFFFFYFQYSNLPL